MTRSTHAVAPPAIRGAVTGLLVLAGFGTAWALAGAIALRGWGAPAPALLAVAPGLALLGRALALRRAAARAPRDGAEVAARRRRWFGLVTVVEFASIGAVVVVGRATRHAALIAPLVALIVGLHFLPLAALFRVRAYYATGAALCLLAALALLLVPAAGTLGGRPVDARTAVVGWGAALVLWGTGVGAWLRGRAPRREEGVRRGRVTGEEVEHAAAPHRAA
ncbi:MAG TPA: hypothetical protein VFW96_25080 [Thermomicrobiales bacterium]|nr:hypothetical protein [Thermomicrobiales bacterium]